MIPDYKHPSYVVNREMTINGRLLSVGELFPVEEVNQHKVAQLLRLNRILPGVPKVTDSSSTEPVIFNPETDVIERRGNKFILISQGKLVGSVSKTVAEALMEAEEPVEIPPEEVKQVK